MADSLLDEVTAKRPDVYPHALSLTAKMTDGQRPRALLIGCSDSRALPEAIMGAGPGEVFVCRVIGNIAPPPGAADSAMMGAVLEYAIAHLKVGHLIVCGHTHCGARRAGGRAPESHRGGECPLAVGAHPRV